MLARVQWRVAARRRALELVRGDIFGPGTERRGVLFRVDIVPSVRLALVLRGTGGRGRVERRLRHAEVERLEIVRLGVHRLGRRSDNRTCDERGRNSFARIVNLHHKERLAVLADFHRKRQGVRGAVQMERHLRKKQHVPCAHRVAAHSSFRIAHGKATRRAPWSAGARQTRYRRHA